jgi:hypothetical protein
MNRPIKPNKPSKRDVPPSEDVTISKLLAFDTVGDVFVLLDAKTNPVFFVGTETMDDGEIAINYDKLDEFGYDWSLEILKYSDYQKICKDCNIEVDFTVYPQHNRDNYYEFSIVRYKARDENYNDKLKEYETRFERYNKVLEKYENNLRLYDEFKKSEKKRKLEEQLKNL